MISMTEQEWQDAEHVDPSKIYVHPAVTPSYKRSMLGAAACFLAAPIVLVSFLATAAPSIGTGQGPNGSSGTNSCICFRPNQGGQPPLGTPTSSTPSRTSNCGCVASNGLHAGPI